MGGAWGELGGATGGAAGLPLNELRGLPGFKVGHLNVRSLTSKIEQLRLDLPKSGLDILTISETWLNSETEKKLTTIEGYQFIGLDRREKQQNGQIKKGGGVGIYYQDYLSVDVETHRALNHSNNTIELQWAIVDRPHAKKILIGTVYKPPEGNLNNAIDLIDQSMQMMPNLDKYETLLMGDFNTDYAKKLPKTNALKQFASTHELQQVITGPTRITPNTSTTIDLAFTNLKYCTKAGTLNYNISDHKPIYIIKKKPRTSKKTTVHWGRTYRNYNPQELADTLKANDRTKIISEKDPNKCWSLLWECMQRAADKHCPLVKMNIRTKPADYLTNELIELQQDRDYFVQKAEQTKDPGDWFIAKCMIKQARTEIRKAKSNFYRELIIKNRQNPKKFWRTIAKIEPDAKPTISRLYYEDKKTTIPNHQLAEEINNFFVDIGENLARNIEPAEETTNHNTVENNQHYDITNVNQEQIVSKINKLSPYKSSGLHNMSSTLVKTAMLALLPEFTHLYNNIITTGNFPDPWKVAMVMPIPKTATPKTCNELRPISILPLPGKIIEQLIHDQIKEFLESSKYLSNQQNGFRKDRSTTKALATILDELLTNTDNGELTIAVFLDFKKAFDTINHDILLNKTKKAGLGIKTRTFLENYLTNRKQYTQINGMKSTLRNVQTGVPQGSTIGPLLFLIYVNDLPRVSDKVAFTLFADDTVLTAHSSNLQQAALTVQRVLADIAAWCKNNKLTLNANKTEYVIYGTKIRKSKAPQISLSIDGATIKEVEAYKYLGTTLDSTLTAKSQLSRLNQTLALKLKTLRKMRNFISENTALLLYKTTILPIIDYNDIIYSLLTQQQALKLQRIQNRALRTIYRDRQLNTQELHDKAKIDQLATRRNIHLLALMYRRTKEPDYVDLTNRRTRTADGITLRVPRPKTNRLIKAPIFAGSKLWNALPHKVKSKPTYERFKAAARAHLLGPDAPAWSDPGH